MAKRKKDPNEPRQIKAPPYALVGDDVHTAEGYVRMLIKRAMDSAATDSNADTPTPPYYYNMHK